MIRIFALLLGLLTWMSAAPANMLLTGAGGGGGGTSVSLVQNALGTQAAGLSNSQTVSLTGVNASNIVIAATFTCNDASCVVTDTPTTTVTPTSGSCAAITGTATFNQLRSSTLFLCTGGSGSQTYTSSWGCIGGDCSFGFVTVIELSGQAASTPTEGGNVASGSSTALSVTSGTLSQSSGEMVYAFFAKVLASSPQTIVDRGVYQITSGCSSCTVTDSATISPTSDWSGSIVGIKHQ